jgi:predicted XRE-type DNA-binding protein
MLHAGSGISEIGIHLDSGGHRVLYVAELAGTITVLHCFQKKAAQTSAADATLARRRFHDLKPVSPRGYDNIWDAIESSREAAASMTLRSQLLTKLRDITEARALSQPLAAKFLGTTQTRIAEVQQGRIDLFSIDALITMLITAGCQVGMTVTPGRA